jgi:esterase
MQEYDELALFGENASEMGLDPAALPTVQRVQTRVGPAQSVSALNWNPGPTAPSLVLVHGGAQNAHTWDNVLIALGLPALAVDLPGHGRSDWRQDQDYSAQQNAVAVAEVLRQRAQSPVLLVGMSMGGLAAISLAAQFPELVKAMTLVDVSPQSGIRSTEMTQAQMGSVALASGPPSFPDFDTMLEATVAAAPSRSLASLRRGLLHNARELADGTWRWRYDQLRGAPVNEARANQGWDELASTRMPLTLVRGGESAFVADADVDRMRAIRPDLQIEVVAGSGHSVQSDRPKELLAILRRFLADNASTAG